MRHAAVDPLLLLLWLLLLPSFIPPQ